MNAPPSWPWSCCNLAAEHGARAAPAGLRAETGADACFLAEQLKGSCPLVSAASAPLLPPPGQNKHHTEN